MEEGLWEDRREDYPEKVIDEYYVDDTDEEMEEMEALEEGDGDRDLEKGDVRVAWPLSDDSASVAESNAVSSVSDTTAQKDGTLRTIVSPVTEKGFGGMF